MEDNLSENLGGRNLDKFHSPRCSVAGFCYSGN